MSSRLQYFFNLNRQIRICVRFLTESLAILSAYFLWISLIDGSEKLLLPVHIFNAGAWVLAYKIFGLDKDRLRFSSVASYLPIFKLSLFLGALLTIESLVITSSVDVVACLFFVLLSLNIIIGLRVLARQLIRKNSSKKRENILVYGTSDVAIDLVNAIAFGKKYNVIGFISDRHQNVGTLAGLPIIPFANLKSYASRYACKLVVLTSKEMSLAAQTDVLLRLDKLGLSVSYAPTMDRAFDYEVQLKAIRPEEVLGRTSEVKFDEVVHTELHKKTILVTGAGGSIGSEICRQILRYNPARLVILELNEFALYNIEQELSEILASRQITVQTSYYLGSVTDAVILSRIFTEQKINFVYHAAAYKHVPIVEGNVIAGITNNVFGTKCLADFASRFGVDKFVLVSTDKAVRPTNVMGASKRLSELIIQDLSLASETIFTMVRFGNVLGSSGSVIPKFKSQINAGGPVTVTDQEITRYFMSIPEAAHLVLNAGTFSNGGDVFLLDMGDPVKILELAKSMIRQHGLQPILAAELGQRNKRDNEIVIEFTGLRPGEKLYEELLIDGVAEATPNPKIFKSEDGLHGDFNLANALELLQKEIQNGCSKAIVDQLQTLPLSYKPDTNLDFQQHIEIESDDAVIGECLNFEAQKISEPYAFHQQTPSLLTRVMSSRLGLFLLHRYFYIVRGMTLGVRVLVQNQKNDVLLVEHTYINGWHLPGGGIDHGEDAESAALREVYEECGIQDLTNIQLVSFVYNSSISKRDHVVYFRAFSSQDPQLISSPEIKEARFFSVDNLPTETDPSVFEALSKYNLLSNETKS